MRGDTSMNETFKAKGKKEWTITDTELIYDGKRKSLNDLISFYLPLDKFTEVSVKFKNEETFKLYIPFYAQNKFKKVEEYVQTNFVDLYWKKQREEKEAKNRSEYYSARRNQVADALTSEPFSVPTLPPKDASVVGRPVVGGIIAGPVGAAVGALSAADNNNKNRSKK